jgi:tetratricopeptide (TPR) repeat protein
MNKHRVNELLIKAEELARESNDVLALTTVLRGKLFFSGNPTQYPEAQTIIDELERLIHSKPFLWTLPLLNILLFRITSAIQRGDQSSIRAAIDDFGETARKFKAVELSWYHQRFGVVQRMNAGEMDGVGETLSELRRQSEEFGLETGRMLSDLDLGVFLSLTSDIRPLAAEFIDRLAFDEADPPSIWAAKIQKMVEFGSPIRAEAALRRIAVADIYELPVDLSYVATLCYLAVGSIGVQAMEYVDAVYRLLSPFSQYYAAGFSFHCDGSVSYYLGMLARALGRNDDAIAHFENALEQNARFDLKAHVIRTRCELASTLAEDTGRTDKSRARSLLNQAMEDARKLGLHRLFDDAQQLLTRV